MTEPPTPSDACCSLHCQHKLADRFNIRSIPTMAIFKNGREIARQSGALDLGSLKRWIQPHLHQP